MLEKLTKFTHKREFTRHARELAAWPAIFNHYYTNELKNHLDSLFSIGFDPDHDDLVNETLLTTVNLMDSFHAGKTHPEVKAVIARSASPYIPILERLISDDPRDSRRDERIFMVFQYIQSLIPPQYIPIDEVYQRHMDHLIRQTIQGSTAHAYSLAEYLAYNVDRFSEVLPQFERIGADRVNRGAIPAVTELIQALRIRGIHAFSEPLIRTSLAWYGIPDKLYDKWIGYFMNNNNRDTYIDENCIRIFDAESRRPGAITRLYRKNRLRQFGRYNTETLLYTDDQNECPSPFPADEMIVHAANLFDDDGALHQGPEVKRTLINICERVREHGVDARCTFIEFHSARSLYQSLVTIISTKPKHITLIIDSHASRTGITLDNDFIFGREFLENPIIYDLVHATHIPMTVIFDGCSTGKRGGMAQRLSKNGIVCMGTREKTSIKSYVFSYADPHLNIYPLYYNGDTVVYSFGREMT